MNLSLRAILDFPARVMTAVYAPSPIDTKKLSAAAEAAHRAGLIGEFRRESLSEGFPTVWSAQQIAIGRAIVDNNLARQHGSPPERAAADTFRAALKDSMPRLSYVSSMLKIAGQVNGE